MPNITQQHINTWKKQHTHVFQLTIKSPNGKGEKSTWLKKPTRQILKFALTKANTAHGANDVVGSSQVILERV